MFKVLRLLLMASGFRLCLARFLVSFGMQMEKSTPSNTINYGKQPKRHNKSLHKHPTQAVPVQEATSLDQKIHQTCFQRTGFGQRTSWGCLHIPSEGSGSKSDWDDRREDGIVNCILDVPGIVAVFLLFVIYNDRSYRKYRRSRSVWVWSWTKLLSTYCQVKQRQSDDFVENSCKGAAKFHHPQKKGSMTRWDTYWSITEHHKTSRTQNENGHGTIWS